MQSQIKVLLFEVFKDDNRVLLMPFLQSYIVSFYTFFRQTINSGLGSKHPNTSVHQASKRLKTCSVYNVYVKYQYCTGTGIS